MTVTILKGDCREVLGTLPAESVHCVVTSPPYFGLRDYGVAGQIGLEPTPEAFTAELVRVFAAIRRTLRCDGTIWLNLGDSYTSAGGGGEARMVELHGARDTDFRRGVLTEGRSGKREYQRVGLKAKDLIGIPWRVAFALQEDGWYLRQDIIWSKPNPMPESVRDRCTKAHEYLFLLSKSERYWYDADAIAERLADASIERLSQATLEQQQGSDRVPGKTNGRMKAVGGNIDGNMSERGITRTTEGLNLKSAAEKLRADGKRNKRSVWEVTTQPFSEAHFATFPPALIEPCILAGCPKGGTVLDPFFGAGTTGLVADRLGRNCIGIELNPTYADMAERRIRKDAGMFASVE